MTPISRNSGISMRAISAPRRDSVSSARSKVLATASSRSSSATVVGTASRMPLMGRRRIGATGSSARAAPRRQRRGVLGGRGVLLQRPGAGGGHLPLDIEELLDRDGNAGKGRRRGVGFSQAVRRVWGAKGGGLGGMDEGGLAFARGISD